MCGISGLIDYKRNSSEKILIECTNTLSHRGPDGYGYDFTENEFCQIGLGHRRLSILDLSEAGAQPMHYKHLSITYNGEIYNYAEIRQELIQQGHQFHSGSDTEVILHAYEEWGADMVSRFFGMFAFAIYDRRNQELICFRDRSGIKPFYYYQNDGLFLFASELKAFHKHPEFKKEINPQSVHQFFQYGYVLAPLSIFKHTCKLEPGHYLKIDLKTKHIQNECYWNVYDYYNKPKLDIGYNEATAHIEELLISSCKYRMISDVPVGVFLSGGYDSTAVTALLQANQKETLNTFTIGFYEEDHNEAAYAKRIAKHLGTNHTEYYCTIKDALEILPNIPYFCDEPFGDSSIIPTTLVSQLARKQVTVALSADAGDEIFAGYLKYPISLNFKKLIDFIPSPLRPLTGNMLKLTPNGFLKFISRNPAVDMKKERLADLFIQKNVSSLELMDQFLSQVFTSKQLKNVFNNLPERAVSNFDTHHLLRQDLGEIDSMLAIDYKTYLADDILVKVDRAGMSVSLEGREPLLDHRIIEFAARLPEHYKMKGNNKKIILKDIVHKYVPKEMIERPKMGFGVPVFSWLRNELRHFSDEYFQESAFNHGFFKPEAVQRIISQFYKGDKNYNNPFWYLLMFQMWYQKWMK